MQLKSLIFAERLGIDCNIHVHHRLNEILHCDIASPRQSNIHLNTTVVYMDNQYNFTHFKIILLVKQHNIHYYTTHSPVIALVDGDDGIGVDDVTEHDNSLRVVGKHRGAVAHDNLSGRCGQR